MTRASFCQEIPSRGQNYIHSFPPWGVPNRRKPRGVGRDCRRLYDPTRGCLFSSRGSEVTTQNRYSPLVEMSVDIINDKKRKGPLQEFGPSQHRRSPRRYHSEHKNLYRNPGEDFAYSFSYYDDDYVYKNKINFCSGYFSNYISYPSVNIINNNSKNIKSKNVISGTQQEENTPQPPGCRIVAKSSRIGTLGGTQRSQHEHKKKEPTRNQPPSCRIVANDPRIVTIKRREIPKNQPPSW